MLTPNTSGYAPVNGLNMYYEIYGQGSTPLVLIHGGGSTIETSFGELIPLLAVHTPLIAVELQAHGRTSDRDGPESFEQDAADVSALLHFLGIKKANFLGFSNGGSTTMRIAMHYPDLVHRIIVISAHYNRAGFIPGFFEGLGSATLDDMPQALKDGYRKVSSNPDGLQVMFDKDRMRMLQFSDWPESDLLSIHAPTLLMVADRDVITTAHVLSMSQLIPNAQLAVLPGGHGSFIGEIGTFRQGSRLPGVTTLLVMEFLESGI